MKNNKKINLIFIMLIIFIMGLNFCNIAYGTGDGLLDVVENPKDFEPNGINGETSLSQKIGVILGVINTAGIVSAVITLMVLGIRYMLGSVEEQAEYKKSMGMYILGIFLAVSITTVPNIIYKISSDIK